MNVLTLLIGTAAGVFGTKWIQHRKVTGKTTSNISVKTSQLPNYLGLKKDAIALYTAVDRLENALRPDYMNAVKERLIKKGKLSEKEYDLHYYELKRYFLLTTILKNVPMYNEKVDDIWHEMMLFTRSYQQFCMDFAGKMIHHEPNLHPVPNPNEKSIFSYTYGSFFESHNYTKHIYPWFQQEVLTKEFLQILKDDSEQAILARYFDPIGSLEKRVLLTILQKTKEQVAQMVRTKKAPAGIKASSKNYASQDDYVLGNFVAQGVVDVDSPSSTVASSGESSSSSSSNCSSSSCSSSCGGGCSS